MQDEFILGTPENADAEEKDPIYADSDNENPEFSPEPAEEILDADIELMKNEFSELSEITDITELPNPTRYAALRDLGLTPKEAYLATAPVKKTDNRSHLVSGVPHSAKSPVSSMTRREWNIARALFEDMSDFEIEKLYKKVTR